MYPHIDVAIIGAGVVGLAAAYHLSVKYPGISIAVLEKNKKYGEEISSRNSEVLHSGIYYPKTFLKTQLCIEGQALIYEFCQRYSIGHRRLGKYIVAYNDKQTDDLFRLYQNGVNNGVDLELVSARQLHNNEPLIHAKQALLSPATGIINVHEYMSVLYYLARRQGVSFLFSTQLVDLEYTGGCYLLITEQEKFYSNYIINAAGLGCLNIPAMLGLNPGENGYRLFYCKGEYFKVNKEVPIQHLIYPLPQQGLLGIHLTLDMNNNLRLGPSAAYIDEIDYCVEPDNRELFYRAVHPFWPDLHPEDISPDFAGVRPRIQGPEENDPVDFIIREEADRGFPGLIDLIGIESPGLTSSLAIAKYVETLLNL